jgi:hypothetical protein
MQLSTPKRASRVRQTALGGSRRREHHSFRHQAPSAYAGGSPRTLGLTVHSPSSHAVLRAVPRFPIYAHYGVASASSSRHNAPESVRQGPPPGAICSPKGVYPLWVAVGGSHHTSSSHRKRCRVRPNSSVELTRYGTAALPSSRQKLSFGHQGGAAFAVSSPLR